MPITAYDLNFDSVGKPIKIIRLPVKSAKTLIFCLRDEHGEICPLTHNDRPLEQIIDANSPVPSPANSNIRLAWKIEPYGEKRSITGIIILEHPGHVSFTLTSAYTQPVGLHKAQIGLFSSEQLLHVWPVYLHFEPSLFDDDVDNQQPWRVTTAEIRLALMDFFSPDEWDTQLLPDVEFSDIDIAAAMQRCVDLWNETPPSVTWHTLDSFPYRYWLINGTIALLLRSMAAKYRRNSMAYSAGGVSITDQQRAQEYEAIAAARIKEFIDWMTSEKIAINRSYCWGVGI